MSKKSKLTTIAVGTLFSLGVLGITSDGVLAQDDADMERCYGIVRAGMNDCETSKHSCRGVSTRDGAADEWMLVPNGTCSKIVHGVVK